MMPAEFAARAVGVPWKRWASEWSGMDCYGLIVLYFREVLGMDLGPVPQTDIAGGFHDLSSHWVQCEAEPGVAAFMSFDRGAPKHCGVLLPDAELLHAQGGHDDRGIAFGNTRISRLASWSRLFPDTRFYRYAGQAC